KIDRPAHGTRSIEHGGIAFLNLHGRNISGEKASEIEAVVSGEVNSEPLPHHRHLPTNETPPQKVSLLAPPVRVDRARHARQHVDGLVEARPAECPGLLTREHRAANYSDNVDRWSSDVDDLAKAKHGL